MNYPPTSPCGPSVSPVQTTIWPRCTRSWRATRAAREVAEKFANDSQSKRGKIKTANQGQFSITDRDSNTPYIKKVRVVATVEYYLSD